MSTRRSLCRFAIPTVGLLIVAGMIFQVRAARSLPFCADVAAVTPTVASLPRVVAEGHLVARAGAEVRVGTDLPGIVAQVAVIEKQKVRRGQLLATLDTREREAELLEAQARMREADADIALFDAQVRRTEPLLAEKVISQDEADRPRRDRDAAIARKASAEAAVRRVEATLARARFVAPIDGVVTSRAVDPGESVDIGNEIVTLADLSRLRFEAEVDEYDVGRIVLGDPVTLTAEGFDGQSWKGVVEEIPDTVTSRRLKPQDPGKPVDTRVLLVKIALGEPVPLKLGQRATVVIGADTAQQ